MHILSIHNRYKIRGGEEEVFEAEAQLLREHGHEVDEYVKDNEQLESLSSLATATKTIWSQTAYQQVSEHLKLCSANVVHVHNFLPLISPAVYYAARDQGVPVVQTLHNYRLLCPNALFFREGQVCTDCLGKPIPWPGIKHSCYRQNRPASAVTATMLSIHRVLKTWHNMVDCYITLTEFARQQFIKGGLPPHKIVVKPNFVKPEPSPGNGEGNYALYVGRLSVEKGLDTLLDAWESLDTHIPLKIVGDGPLADDVVQVTQKLTNVEWLGRKPMKEVHDLMGKATCLVFPSKWYETFGRVVIEAFATGTPVIASNIGAVAELIEPGKTGLYFEPGNSKDLANTIRLLLEDSSTLTQMRQASRAEFEKKYTAGKNYSQLIDIYQTAREVSASINGTA